ncbi:PaaI family thioesterase [Arthrobacter globiformis]|uniref:PaaI family thioesterase n=1 Tax=Arthrobacter globiformis TaxID=1665 RepID=UPI002793EAAD|nr:PaaI family thioesterase [Arthrobacter globiformis]MDQ0616703.1 uncharacterized protein (TIGR00369 family) [Arthrobacter globiformis]
MTTELPTQQALAGCPTFPADADALPAEILSGSRLEAAGDEWSLGSMQLPSEAIPDEISLGLFGVLADMTTGNALARSLPPLTSLRTVNLRMDVVGELATPGEMVQARGEQLCLNEHSGVSQTTVRRPDGAALLVCTARFIVVPHQPLEPLLSGQQEAMQLRQSAVVSELLGVTAVAHRGEEVQTLITPSDRMANHHGVVHGGLHVGMADFALRRAAQGKAGALPVRLVDLALTYHRPIVISQERQLVIRSRVERRGQRVIIVSADIESTSGRLLTSSQGTALLQ